MFRCLCGHKQLLGNKCAACGRANQMRRVEEAEDDADDGLSIAVSASLFSLNTSDPPDSSSDSPPSDTFDGGDGSSGGGGSSGDF